MVIDWPALQWVMREKSSVGHATDAAGGGD